LHNIRKPAENLQGLVVFDVEGVLLPKRRYIPFEATRKLGFLKFMKILFHGLLYELGLSTLETAQKQIFKCLKGHTVQELRQYYKKMPLLPGTKKLFETLHKKGWKTALISSGIPNQFVQELAAELKADYAYGLKLKTKNNKFTGQIEGTTTQKNGKAKLLKKIQTQENLPKEKCILVADDRNNLQMYPHVHQTIGYNPDFLLTAKSNHVVTGNLTHILPIITKTKPKRQTITKNQLLRTTIHITGFTIPFINTHILNPPLTTLLILIVTTLYTISELARITGTTIPPFKTITTKAAVKLEPYEFATAPIFYALGITLSLTLFPQHIAYTAITTLTLGDGFASIFGQKIGKTPYPFNKAKNLEGSILGFTTAFLGATLFTNPLRALIAAVTGMTIECLPLPINDNLTIPLTVGTILTAIPL
jgi:HAD superfamily phosphoserine phosphatase-like hydrolase